MSDNNQNKKPIHEYDGIQELDNNLPRWWLAVFYITAIFAVIYYVHYEMGNGPSIQKEYQNEMAEVDALKAKNQGSFPNESNMQAVLGQAESKKKGAQLFATRCASCHGAQGEGLIGPNLTDGYWINGDGQPASIAKVIHEGVLAKGMPAWNALMSENEIYEVTAFVASLKGTNPKNGKAPQGNLVK